MVKLPKWPFDKFVYAKRTLGTQMKATGEVMAIGRTFEEALMKAVRGAEISHLSLDTPELKDLPEEEIRRRLAKVKHIRKDRTPALDRYSALVTSADQGAVLKTPEELARERAEKSQ